MKRYFLCLIFVLFTFTAVQITAAADDSDVGSPPPLIVSNEASFDDFSAYDVSLNQYMEDSSVYSANFSVSEAENETVISNFASGSSAYCGSVLTGQDLIIYEKLKEQIKQVADASRTSTVFEISSSDLLGAPVFYADDLNVGQISDDNIGNLIASLFNFDLTKIVNALIADCPYELYWFNNQEDIRITYPIVSYTADAIYFSVESKISFSFPVTSDYSAGRYETAPEKTTLAASVPAAVEQIVLEVADQTNYNKLLYYKEQICQLTCHTAEALIGSETCGNLWQLINIFDGNEDTISLSGGYARAFQYLCEKTTFTSPVQCITVEGTLNGIPHLWNIVQMTDGCNYLVDVYHCDTDGLGTPGLLFLTGASYVGSSNEYSISVNGTVLIYSYSDSTLSRYSSSVLALSGTDYPVPAHSHLYLTQVVAPTCTTDGYTLYSCSCGDTYTGNYIYATGHKYNAAVTPPTRNSGGFTTYTCSVCGDFYTGDYVDPITPKTPVLDSITCVDDGIQLKWYETDYANTYWIYRMTPGEEWALIQEVSGSVSRAGADPISWLDCSQLVHGTTYFYTVRAYYDDGINASVLSDYDHNGLSVNYLSAPALKSADCLSDGIRITWDSLSNVSYYGIFRKLNSESEWSLLSTASGTSFTDVSAINKEQYVYTVKAYNGNWGCYDASGLSCEFITTPELQDVYNDGSNIKLTWASVPGIDAYDVYYAENGGSWSSPLRVTASEGDIQTYTDTSPVPGKIYVYTVRAVDSATNSQSYYDVNGKTMLCIRQPEITDYSSGPGYIAIYWTSAPGASSYNVYRRLTESDSDWDYITSTSGCSYADTSVTAGVEYTYTVLGTNGNYFSSYNVKGVSYLTMAAPAPVSAMSNDNIDHLGIIFSWDSVTSADKYYIYRRSGSEDWINIAEVLSDQTEYIDYSVIYGTEYTYTVRAMNCTYGLLSPYDSAGKTAAALSAPVLLSASGNSNGITVHWKPLSANSYDVYRKTSESSAWERLGNSTDTEYNDTTASCGVHYIYTVVAQVNSLWSSYDAAGISAARLAIPSLNAVYNYASSTESGIFVSWDSVEGAQYYRVFRKCDCGGWLMVGDRLTFPSFFDSHSGLTIGKSYSYTVRAVYDSGAGFSISGYSSADTSCKYIKTPLNLSSSDSSAGITIEWNRIFFISGYTVYRKTDTSDWSLIAIIYGDHNVSYTDSSALPDTNYTYTVCAFDGNSFSYYNPEGTAMMHTI